GSSFVPFVFTLVSFVVSFSITQLPDSPITRSTRKASAAAEALFRRQADLGRPENYFTFTMIMASV
ncbi:MAG TPA: hypothetical protein VMS96_03460, partial [Terriglobales bacterium]|nr:hypothetical protein [Terriglobales bacterium]